MVENDVAVDVREQELPCPRPVRYGRGDNVVVPVRTAIGERGATQRDVSVRALFAGRVLPQLQHPRVPGRSWLGAGTADAFPGVVRAQRHRGAESAR